MRFLRYCRRFRYQVFKKLFIILLQLFILCIPSVLFIRGVEILPIQHRLRSFCEKFYTHLTVIVVPAIWIGAELGQDLFPWSPDAAYWGALFGWAALPPSIFGVRPFLFPCTHAVL
jgi:hypothetical protein